MYMKDYKYENTIEIARFTKKGINKLIVVVPPLGFFLGGIWVFGIIASTGFEGWDKDKYNLIPAIIMMVLAVIMFITFIIMYHYQEKIISDRRIIFDYDINKLIISPHGMKYFTIDLYDIKKIDCGYFDNIEKIVIKLKNNKVYSAPTNDANDSYNMFEILASKFSSNSEQDDNTIIY